MTSLKFLSAYTSGPLAILLVVAALLKIPGV